MPKLFTRTSTATAKKTLRIFWQEMTKNKRLLIAYIVAIPLNRLLYIVLLPLVFSLIIQSLILHPTDWQHPVVLLGVAALISAASLVAAQVGFRHLFVHQELMHTALLEKAMQVLMNHSDQFFANRKVGALAGDVNTFSRSVIGFTDLVFMQSAGIVMNFSASLVIVGILSPILLLPLGIVTLVIIIQSVIGSTRRGPIRHQRKVLLSQLNGSVADILGNQPIVRYFATAGRETTKLVHDRQEIEQVAHREIAIIQRESVKRQAVLFAFQIITLAVCIWLAAHHAVTIAALVFAITYLGRLTSMLFDISPIIRNLEQTFLDAANVTEIIDQPPEVADTPNAKTLKVTKGAVAFRDVSFAYKDSGSSNVIDHISLDIKPGERVGLAGHSGGGKTTLTKLVLRFADVTGGEVTIDGQNIAEVTQDSLRSQIAYVPQEPYLFHRSLRDNIAYGRPDATDKQVMAAVTQANARDFIDALPDGLDTIVGERGVKLSGGQRQRIAIARAILKDAPILVLDEATSALDSESEKLIQDALEKLMKNRTSIVVAHRLSTIAHLDKIVVIDSGRIAEIGPHAQLLKQKGTYAKLWAHQSGGFLDD